MRYVHPLIDTQRDLLKNTLTHDTSPRARARAHSLLLRAEGMTIKEITKIYQQFPLMLRKSYVLKFRPK